MSSTKANFMSNEKANKPMWIIHTICFMLALSLSLYVLKPFWDENNQNGLNKNEFLEQGKRSEAHRFLVNNWVECRFYNSTKASCYANILTLAKVRGPMFEKQVQIAAIELHLI